MRNGHVFLKSGLKVKSQNQKKITIKLNCLSFFQKSYAKRKQNEYIFTIMLQMIRLWSIFKYNLVNHNKIKVKKAE
jgi:hypothetical protein